MEPNKVLKTCTECTGLWLYKYNPIKLEEVAIFSIFIFTAKVCIHVHVITGLWISINEVFNI